MADDQTIEIEIDEGQSDALNSPKTEPEASSTETPAETPAEVPAETVDALGDPAPPAGAAEAASADGDKDSAVQPETEARKKPSKYKKRIDDLVFRQREAERQRDEYYQVAQKLVSENQRLRQQAQSYSAASAEEMEGRLTAEMAQARAAMKQAHEAGDSDSLVEAQERMARAAADQQRLQAAKQAAQPENFAAPSAELTPPPDTRLQSWLADNPWFNQDKIMTQAAYAIHDELQQRGVQPASEHYYQEIDNRLREEFPHKFQADTAASQDALRPAPSSVAPVVTPGGHEHKPPRKIRLSPSQVAVAKRLGVSLDSYAREFAALS